MLDAVCLFEVCADFVVNAQIHPTVAGFFNLNRERIILRYCHLHPTVSESMLDSLLSYRPTHFHWAGSDLFTVTNAHGTRQSIIIETNSCPSGQKSMPLLQDTDEYGGYRKVFTNHALLNNARLLNNLLGCKKTFPRNGAVLPLSGTRMRWRQVATPPSWPISATKMSSWQHTTMTTQTPLLNSSMVPFPSSFMLTVFRYHAASYSRSDMAPRSRVFPIRHQRTLETYPHANENPRHE